jgi:hypothetical protein
MMVEKAPQSLCYSKPCFYIKTKQCIPCSKVERLGSGMIRESLNQGKAYPINSCERNRNF